MLLNSSSRGGVSFEVDTVVVEEVRAKASQYNLSRSCGGDGGAPLALLPCPLLLLLLFHFSQSLEGQESLCRQC